MADVCVRSSVSGCGAAARREPAVNLLNLLHRLEPGHLQVQRVLHVARRMLLRHVERFEVVVVVLDLAALEHLVAEAREDGADLVADQAERMPESRARARGPAG